MQFRAAVIQIRGTLLVQNCRTNCMNHISAESCAFFTQPGHTTKWCQILPSYSYQVKIVKKKPYSFVSTLCLSPLYSTWVIWFLLFCYYLFKKNNNSFLEGLKLCSHYNFVKSTCFCLLGFLDWNLDLFWRFYYSL